MSSQRVPRPAQTTRSRRLPVPDAASGGAAVVRMGPDWGESGKPAQEQELGQPPIKVVYGLAEQESIGAMVQIVHSVGPNEQQQIAVSERVAAALGGQQALALIEKQLMGISQNQAFAGAFAVQNIMQFKAAGSYTVTIPFAALAVFLEGGGEGGLNGSGTQGGTGGQGASFVRKTVSGLTVGGTKTLVVGAAGAANGGDGGDSTWDTSVAVAKGGGSATANVGDIIRTGGNGAAGVLAGAGGGGGGGAGASSNGSNGSGQTGGNGGTGAFAGGKGGNGGASGANGAVGAAPGAGGGGGGFSLTAPGTGGLGGRGEAWIQWFP